MVTETEKEDSRPGEVEGVHSDQAPEPPEDEEGGPVKTFLEHLEDLRWVLIKSGSALMLGMLVCLLAGDKMVEILKRPLTRAKIPFPGTNQVVTLRWFGTTNRVGTFPLAPAAQDAFNFGSNRFVALQLVPVAVGTNHFLALQLDPTAGAETGIYRNVELINLAPAGGFIVALQVAFYGGMVLAAPFIFFFVAQFVFPALKMAEKRYIYPGLGWGFGLFASGVAFCYFLLMPLALAASFKYSNWLGFGADQWRAEEYISFVCKFMLGMGLGFQLPVVLLVLVKIGILSYATLSKARPYMIVINLILGAVLTTPEVITQVAMAIPMQCLYEITVWVAWWWERRERKRAEAEARAGSGSA
jgi:sec-independent protein translocase protein TatC